MAVVDMETIMKWTRIVISSAIKQGSSMKNINCPCRVPVAPGRWGAPGGSSLPIFICLCLALLGLAGCSTPSDHIGSGDVQLKVGRKYTLQRDAILLANRGYVDSIENPDRNIQDYKPYRDYHPYYTGPRGVLPGGTVIEVEKIRFFKRNQFLVMGEIKTGDYKKQTVTPYTVTKWVFGGDWPPDGIVVMNGLCGGRSFDPHELARNLSERAD